MTNRALVLSALVDGPSRIHQPLRSRDTDLMAGALRALGISIERDGVDWVVSGGAFREPTEQLDVGNAGTVARFVPPVAALVPGEVRLDGDARIRERPLAPLVQALRELGVRIEASASDGLPLTVHGSAAVAGGEVTVDASSSSQFVSGLLLAGPRYARGITVRHVGLSLPSAPHLAMTVSMLRAAGAVVDDSEAGTWRVGATALTAQEWQIEPDLSSAAPFLAAAVAAGGRVRIPGWPATSTQPGARMPELLHLMGASAERVDDTLVVTGPERIDGVDVDLRDCGELTPVIAALAALAASPSRLSGIAHLRRHETDRLAALAQQINGLGGDVEETADGLLITPRALHGGTFETYDDHRMAMAGAVIGLVTADVVLDDVGTTAKTLPDFPQMWAAMLGVAGDTS